MHALMETDSLSCLAMQYLINLPDGSSERQGRLLPARVVTYWLGAKHGFFAALLAGSVRRALCILGKL